MVSDWRVPLSAWPSISLNTSRNCFGVELAGFLQILDSDLHGKERIAQFMRKTARQFAPRGHTLGLHEALFCAPQEFASCD